MDRLDGPIDAMGIRLVYGLKTEDTSYLDSFYPSRRLAEAARVLGVDYAASIHFPGYPFSRAGDFCAGHVALLRGELPLELYEELESAGITVVNGAAATALAADKLLQARRYGAIGADHPRTAPLDTSAASPPIDMPLVVKPRFGMMGRGVALVDSPDLWRSFVDSGEAKRVPYVAQEYIASSRGRDVRFFFARFDDKAPYPTPVVVLRRGDGLTSNAHSGGSMRPFYPPSGLAAEARRLFIDSGLVYGTVDFLFADDSGTEFVVCETNACPGFEALEGMGGIDAARAILLSALEAKGTT